jgi:hypothetical protein
MERTENSMKSVQEIKRHITTCQESLVALYMDREEAKVDPELFEMAAANIRAEMREMGKELAKAKDATTTTRG